MAKPKISEFIRLIDAYQSGRIDASSFQEKYEDLYDPDFTEMPVEALHILDELYVDVEAFDETPLPMDHFSVDEAELKECVMRAKMKLNEMQ